MTPPSSGVRGVLTSTLICRMVSRGRWGIPVGLREFMGRERLTRILENVMGAPVTSIASESAPSTSSGGTGFENFSSLWVTGLNSLFVLVHKGLATRSESSTHESIERSLAECLPVLKDTFTNGCEESAPDDCTLDAGRSAPLELSPLHHPDWSGFCNRP